LDGNGKITEVQTASRDITERKRSEEALQLAHQNLQEAYERTIEGWVRALDLRDRETEGHTQRVTELTLKVAARLGFKDEELVHIKRGALLHDMGKMAIPDEILQKPGPLNEAEWEKMRNHPVYAYDMLSPIAYLHKALIIPYYHHERWNGSGYPKGLKGDAIPLEARMFAIVDVWDALCSDRPYRKKVPREEVIAYLRENAGILFDPELVDIFLTVIEEEK
jgi:HD-GYP domain-containing protein (c-di-GMP phosphodiesterase class II)